MAQQLGTIIPFLPRQRWDFVVERNEAVVAPAQVITDGPFACSGFNKLVGTIRTDQSGTIQFQYGFDDTNWDWIEELYIDVASVTTSLQAGAYRYSHPIPSSRLQIVYTHGPQQGFVRYGVYLVPI